MAQDSKKKQKNLFLSLQARWLLAHYERELGVRESGVIENILREKAKSDQLVLPSEEQMIADLANE